MNEKQCPVCGQLRAKPWFVKFQRTYNRCSYCRHIFVQLDENILTQTYENYNDGTFFFNEGNQNYYFDNSNIMSMNLKLEWVRRFHRGNGMLLDVGANFGHFLKVAQDYFDAQGIEISSYAVEWSRNNFHVQNTAASIDNLPLTLTGPYDLVTMWDVIEHLPAWELAIENINRILKPNGLFFFTTPDSSSLIARLLGRYWYHLHPIQHFHLFSRKNLIKILDKSGFDVLDTRYWGRYYNVRYILDRLTHFSSSKGFRGTIQNIKKASGLVLDRRVYLSARDVLGICARKRI